MDSLALFLGMLIVGVIGSVIFVCASERSKVSKIMITSTISTVASIFTPALFQTIKLPSRTNKQADGEKGNFYKYISDLDSMQQKEALAKQQAEQAVSQRRGDADAFTPGASVIKVDGSN